MTVCHFFVNFTRDKDLGILPIFFKHPPQVIEDDLTSFKNVPDQPTFAVLALFVIFNNNIMIINDFESPRFRTIIDEIEDKVKTPYKLSVKVVKDQLERLSNTYVRIKTNSYNIIHEKWFDTIVFFYGRHMFDVILQRSHADILRDRFLFETIQRYQQKHSHVISVPIEKESDYMERLCKDIMNGSVEQVFTNKQLQFLTFRLKFIQHLSRKSNVIEKLQILRDTSPLSVVSQQNYIDIMKALLEHKLDVNVMNKFGTPLFIASENGHVEMMKLFLAYDCNPNLRRLKTSKTPLFIASEKGHTQVVKLLLKHMADPNELTEDGETPLYIAANLGRTDIVELLLENECNVSTCGNSKSPLFTAARLGHTDIVRLLLESSSDPNMRSEDIIHCGQSPLCIASKYGHTNIVDLLLKHMAHPNELTEDGETPLYIAANPRHTDIVEILLENKCNVSTCGNPKSPLFIAARLGHTDLVRLLLESSSDPNMRSEDIIHCGQSPLCIASKYGHANIVKVLLEHKADSNSKPKDGLNPLYIASREGHTDVVKLLIDHKADVNSVVSFKINRRQTIMFSETESFIKTDSSLCVASEKGFADIVLLLLQNESFPNLCRLDSVGLSLSPLCISATYGWKTNIKLLLNYKANPYLQMDHQNVEPPLFKALENGYVEIVQILLKNTADPNFCSVSYECQDQSPLYKACENGHLKIVNILLENNADQNISGEDRTKPLCIAKEKRHQEIVVLLQQFKKEQEHHFRNFLLMNKLRILAMTFRRKEME